MTRINYASLGRWPRIKTPADQRRSRYQFKANWQNTINLLRRELVNLDVETAVIQIDLDGYWIRNDGQLRGDAKVRSPCIILSFDSPIVGALSYPCDSCQEWRHNVRSIALALEALRAVDRYGVTSRAEQYTGWAKLGGPPDSIIAGPPPPQTVDEAIATIRDLAQLRAGRYRRSELLAIATRIIRDNHPDHGGDVGIFKRAQSAREVLKRSEEVNN